MLAGVQGRAEVSTQGCSPGLGPSLEVTKGSLRRRGPGMRCCRDAGQKERAHKEGTGLLKNRMGA